MPIRRFLYVHRKAPHGTIYAMESLEAVLVAAAFEQTVSLLFADDGVYQIVKGQDPGGIGAKDFARAFRVLGDYGIDRIYAEQASLQARGLNIGDLLIDAEALDARRIGELMRRQDVILNF